jgi:hypothetical protein
VVFFINIKESMHFPESVSSWGIKKAQILNKDIWLIFWTGAGTSQNETGATKNRCEQ